MTYQTELKIAGDVRAVYHSLCKDSASHADGISGASMGVYAHVMTALRGVLSEIDESC